MYGQAAQTAIVSEETDFRKPDVFSSSLEIREVGAKGKGVFAAETFAKGRVVIVGKPVYRTPKRTWQTLQVGIDAHIKIDTPFELVNHSCAPNCGIKPNSYHGPVGPRASTSLSLGAQPAP